MLTFSPKHNNRMALCLGPIPDHGVDYKKVMPFSRSWAAVLIMMILFIPMWYGEITVLQYAVDAWGKSADFFLIIALFTTFWLAMWSFFIFIITVLCWR